MPQESKEAKKEETEYAHKEGKKEETQNTQEEGQKEETENEETDKAHKDGQKEETHKAHREPETLSQTTKELLHQAFCKMRFPNHVDAIIASMRKVSLTEHDLLLNLSERAGFDSLQTDEKKRLLQASEFLRDEKTMRSNFAALCNEHFNLAAHCVLPCPLQQDIENMIEAIGYHDNNVNPNELLEFALEYLSSSNSGSKFVLPKLFISKDTKRILRKLSKNLHDCNENNLNGNRVCRLLLGMKGLGKSTLLQAVVIAASLLFPNIIPIYLNYEGFVDLEEPALCTPAKFIQYAVEKRTSHRLIPSDIIATIFQQLEQLNLHVVIFADEFQEVYTMAPNDTRPIVSQYQTIGNGTTGTVWSVLAGSAAVMRDLCYRTLPEDLHSRYPGYARARGLNDTRYVPLNLTPIQSKQEFRALVEFMKAKNHSDTALVDEALESDHALELLFIASGGVFRLLGEALADPNTAIVDQIRRVVKMKDETVAVKVIDFLATHWDGNVWSSPHISPKHFESLKVQMGDIYHLCDRWVLQGTFDNYSASFSVALPLILVFWKNNSDLLTQHEQMCLHYPYSDLGKAAEKLVCQSLVETSKFLGSLPDALKWHDRKLCMNASKLSVIGDNKAQQQVTPMQISGEILKEDPDVYGADATIVDCTNEIIHRIQIKLGASKLERGMPRKQGGIQITNIHAKPTQEKNAHNLILRLKQGSAEFTKWKEFDTFAYRYYLITTRQLSNNTKQYLLANDIDVFDRDFMYDVWLPKIVAWDKEEKLGVYSRKEEQLD